MKTLILSIFFASSVPGLVNDDMYVTKMKETLQLMEQCNSIEEYQQVANTFEIIALAEKDKWLPYYYCAFSYTMMSMQAIDSDMKDLYAEKAQSSIDSGLVMQPVESELLVLQALIYYALIQADPVARGMEYIGLANDALVKAEELNSNNPRIYFLRAQSVYHTPSEFGGGGQAALPLLEQAKEMYDKEIISDDLYPQWGKEEIIRLLEEIEAGGN